MHGNRGQSPANKHRDVAIVSKPRKYVLISVFGGRLVGFEWRAERTCIFTFYATTDPIGQATYVRRVLNLTLTTVVSPAFRMVETKRALHPSVSIPHPTRKLRHLCHLLPVPEQLY
jgi:hypothetical protein